MTESPHCVFISSAEVIDPVFSIRADQTGDLFSLTL